MEIISLKHQSKVVYDKFSLGFSTSDEDLLIINQYHLNNKFSITLQQYDLSKELVIWLSSDLFAEFQFDDVWLIFSRLEQVQVESIFAALKTSLQKIFTQKSPQSFRQDFYRVIDELDNETAKLKTIAAAA